MRLVVGLRNPGPAYHGTRHNVGAEAVELVARRHGVTMRRARLGIRADAGDLALDGSRAVLAVPRTFVNESGSAVAPLARYYRTQPDEILVVHDDIDLPFAKLRGQGGRGAGGHNGVDSIIRSLGTNEFWRLKLGVGRPPGSMDPADYVLRRFATSERPEVDIMVEHAADLIEVAVREGPAMVRQRAGEIES